MVQFDTRLPMMIQQPNLLAAMDAGTTNAANQAGLMRQAEGQNVFRQYGAGAMQGDPAALNALAGFDPTMAQGMRLDQRQDARADASLRLAQEAGARAAREAQDRAAAMAEAQQAQGLMKQLAQAYATGNEQAFGAISAEIAGQPLPMEPQSLQTLDAFITGFSGGLSSIAPAPVEGPAWRAATPEEAALYGSSAGQINDKTGEFKRTPVDNTLTFETTPDGRVIARQGPAEGSEQGRIEPSSPQYMIDTIEGILTDPALDFSTGWRAWTQNIPGTDARRFGARARQLEGQAFLQAFESLKGGGQITEVEGLKATQAIGRLDTAQKAEDYRAALTELQNILKTAQGRPQGWAETQATTNSRVREVEVGGQRFRVEPIDD